MWVGAGEHGVHFDKVVEKILIPAVASPLVAGIAALLATYLAYRITARAREKTVTKGFRLGQIASASLVSLAHGTNDAQKTMGVITLTLISAGALGHDAGPPGVGDRVAAGLAIGLGTYLGGWRIIRTMGKGLTDIQSPQGFAAEAASTTVILTSAHLGFALSTTQVCSGGILGAGLGQALAEVRWGTAGRMVIAWLVTLPAAALVGGGLRERGDARRDLRHRGDRARRAGRRHRHRDRRRAATRCTRQQRQRRPRGQPSAARRRPMSARPPEIQPEI